MTISGTIDQRALNREHNIRIAADSLMAARVNDKSNFGLECDSENPFIQQFQILMLKRKEAAKKLLATNNSLEEEYLNNHFDLYQDQIKKYLGLLDEPLK